MRFWPQSLAVRIIVAELLAIMVVITVLPLVAIALLHDASDAEQQRLLLAQAEMLSRYVDGGTGAVRSTMPDQVKAVFADSYDGRGFLVINAAGVVVAKSGGSHRPAVSSVPRRHEASFVHVRPFVVLSLPVGTDRQRYWIVVSQNEAFPGAIVDDVARRFLWRYSVILVGVLALLPLVNALSIARLTRVVRRTSHQASAIGPETPGIRLNEANLPVEIRDLVSATNRLIDRLETSLARQRQFVSNLAHELKTPLATLKIELETVADGEQPHQVTQSIKRVDHVISQMRDLAELETLDRARLAPIDLVQLTQRLIGEMTPFIYQQRHEVELVSAAASVVVNGNETLLELALRNLIANAVQHTPDKTRITVEVAASSRLTVADDGPGITTEHQKMMTSRFWRADQSRSDNAGLGLSIVERICEVHGASLEVGTSPQGGASFSIDFGRTV